MKTNQNIEKNSLKTKQTKKPSIKTEFEKKEREIAVKEKEIEAYREEQKTLNYMRQADALAEVCTVIFNQDPEDVCWDGDECREKYFDEYAMTLAIRQLAEIHGIDEEELADKFMAVADKYIDTWGEPEGFSYPWFKSLWG